MLRPAVSEMNYSTSNRSLGWIKRGQENVPYSKCQVMATSSHHTHLGAIRDVCQVSSRRLLKTPSSSVLEIADPYCFPHEYIIF